MYCSSETLKRIPYRSGRNVSAALSRRCRIRRRDREGKGAVELQREAVSDPVNTLGLLGLC